MALDLGELSVRLSAQDQLTGALEGAQSAARRTDQVTQQAATGISASTQRMATQYQQLSREAETYATAARTAHSRAETAVESARVAQERLDSAQRDSTTSAEQLDRAQRQVADATQEAERAVRNSESANDRMISSHRRAARAAEDGGRDAVRAIERQEQAMRDAARTAESAGEEAGSGFADRFTGGLDRMSGAAEGAGGSTGGNFIAGFAPRIAQLGSKAGPIGAALAGVAVIGITAGAALADAISDGMEQQRQSDFIQAKLGINEQTMAVLGKAAGDAYSNAWGESIAGNKDALGALIQAGVLTGEEGSPEMQAMLEQATAVADLMGEDVPAVARAAGQAMKNGIATDGTNAFDLLFQSQKNSLNVSEDLLDSQVEYSTQLRALGLEGAEGWGLVAQAVQGGARDTDVAIDGLKELQLRVASGDAQKVTEYWDMLGVNGEEAAKKMAAGGQGARDTLEQLLTGLNNITDPADKSQTAIALFGTKAEDMQAAVNDMDLRTAAQQFGELDGAIDGAMTTMGSNAATEMEMAKRTIEQAKSDLNLMMADAFAPMLGDLAADISAHKPEIITFFTEVGSAAITLTSGMLSFGADFLRIMANIGDASATAMGGIIGTMGDLIGISAKVASAFGADGLSDTLSGLAEGMQNWEDNTKSANDTLRTMADGMDVGATKLSDMRDGLVQTGTEMAAAENLARALGDSVDAVPAGKDIVIQSNSEEQTEALEALGLKVERLPDGTFRVTSNTDDGQRAIDAFIRSNDGKNLQMFVDLEQRRVGYWTSQGVSAQDAPSMQGPVPTLGVAAGAGGATPGRGTGGTFADGGFLPDQAEIRPGSGDGVVQKVRWAEGETGKEAFLPMAPAKRARSVQIMEQVAREFGYGLIEMADGGIVSPQQLDSFSRGIEGAKYVFGGWNGTWETDCSGGASRVVNYATTGDPDAPGRFATGNEGQALAARGFVNGYQEGALNAGWLNGGPGGGHTSVTLPNGVSVEMGGNRGDGQYGGQARAASTFPNVMHYPMQGNPDPGSFDAGAVGNFNSPTTTGDGGSTSSPLSTGRSAGSLATSSGPVDVRVTNFADLSGGVLPDGRTPKAVGNLRIFANGGIESQDPEIATTGGPVRVWAEPQAGPWESYIPGDPAKHSRAVDIWRETGRRLNVQEFADGGFGGYTDKKPRDYMKPTNLYEAAALATGLGFTAASGLAGYVSMAQSGQIDLSKLAPQFDTSSNTIPDLGVAVIDQLKMLVEQNQEVIKTLQAGGLIESNISIDTHNGSMSLDLLKTGIV